jgi:tetratricopeptide (TPR) repeat protein
LKSGHTSFCGLQRALLAASFAGVLFFCSALHAAGAPQVTARFGVHDDFDRVVIGLSAGLDVSSSQSGSVLTLQLKGVGHVAQPSQVGRRVLGMDGGNGVFSIRMAPGTHARVFRVGDRLVIDVAGGEASASSPDKVAAIVSPKEDSAAGQVHIRRFAARRLSELPAPRPAARGVRPSPAPLLPIKTAELLLTPGSPSNPGRDTVAGAVALTPPAAGASPAPMVSAALPQPSAGNAPAPISGSTDAAAVTANSPHAAVTLLAEDADLGGPAMLVPYGKEVGVAAFRRAGTAQIVFDAANPLDLGPLKDDPVFGGVTERVLPDGMNLRMKLSPDLQIRVLRRPGGWALAVVHQQAMLKPITAHAEKGVLTIGAESPGHVVVLGDESTGGKLLVGTQKREGQANPGRHRDAEFIMPPTWQGVVVEPLSDRLSLQPERDGFVLQASAGPRLALLWPEGAAGTAASARIMTRRFDLPNLPLSELHNRLTLAMRDAALTPSLGRFAARMRVAQAMLAEGLDVEARAVVHAATSDDPAHADDPDVAGISAVASWLAARAGGPDAVAALDFDPTSLGNSDEARLWQALFKSGQADLSEPAASLAVTWPIMLQYAPDLRRRLLPEIGRVLGAGGQDKALAALLAAFPDHSLDLSRAGLLERQGKIDQALALYDKIVERPDRLMRALALRDAVEARFAAKKIDAAAAAAALGRQLYAWRGGETDLSLRLRVAHLRIQAGLWRQALALLRETETLFPDAHERIHDAETKLIADLVHGDSASKLSALDLVALADEAASLLSAADADTTLAPVLVDKLLALDLPARAEPILQRLYDNATDPAQKAELGVRLAGLLADQNDTKGALAVLSASKDDGLEAPLISRRGMLRARLLAKSGQTGDALGVLSAIQDEPALELQTGILEQSRSYTEAAKLLSAFIDGPAFAKIPDQLQRNLILRLANDLSELGDLPALHRLRDAQASHFSDGPDAELFAVLTQEPIKATTDLPRAAKELDKLRALPASLSRP